MKRNQLTLSTPCPACQSKLSLKVLGCNSCGTEIRGAISLSPLARLDSEMTHFLMVFIHCGGKIGDVEKALGISYPTVKAKLAQLQEVLSTEIEKDLAPEKASPLTNGNSVMELLQQFERGEISYEEMTLKLTELKEKK